MSTRIRLLTLFFLSMLLAACEAPTVPPSIQNSTELCLTTSTGPVMLTMYYSGEKKAWIENAIKAFKQQQTSCSHPITINASAMGSGQSMQKILAGEQPDIWSPASGLWLALLNQQWREQHPDTSNQQYCVHPDCQLISMDATATPPLILSPIVIAMWKPEAEALGWPLRALGWADLAALSTTAQTWKAYKHPEWGDFKLGHTTPDDSNAGIDALIAEYYTAFGKTRGLTIPDVQSVQAQDFVTNIESSITHYADSSELLADTMFTQGPSYLDAAITYEGLVIQANQRPHLPFPVVAIYPKEGTFYSDHPFAIPQASWVTPTKRAAALMFRAFLLAPEQQKEALHYGFRPIDTDIKLAAPLDSYHGVDPSQPTTVLPIPDQDVVTAINAAWHKLYRRVDIQLLLDCSGNMNDPFTSDGRSKIQAAERDISAFVKLLPGSDHISLNAFSDQDITLVTSSSVHAQRQNIINRANEITPAGSARLYGSIADEILRLQSQPTRYPEVLIVFTDGEDTAQQLTLHQLLKQLTVANMGTQQKVKIFAIAYSQIRSDIDSLTQIAQATGGQEYSGSVANVQRLYSSINQPLVSP
jgi:Ca-activated chloride channel homolog